MTLKSPEDISDSLAKKPNKSIAFKKEVADLDIERDYKKALIVSLKQDIDERRKYAKTIFFFTCGWAFLMFVILFLEGFEVIKLSEKITITLVGTTTANAFGFFYLVTRYLFNTSSKSKSSALKGFKGSGNFPHSSKKTDD